MEYVTSAKSFDLLFIHSTSCSRSEVSAVVK